MARAIVGLVWFSGVVVVCVGTGAGVAFVLYEGMQPYIFLLKRRWCGVLFIGEGEGDNGHDICT